MAKLTKAQHDALSWLAKHGGDGMFDQHGLALAAGETAPVLRLTWNALRDASLLEFYKPTGKGRGRLRITPAGLAALEEEGR